MRPNSLCDLKAKLPGIPWVNLFGAVREAIDIYRSGGFTSYSEKHLAEQLGGGVGVALLILLIRLLVGKI